MSKALRRYRVLVGRHIDGDRTYIAGTKDDVVVTDRDLVGMLKGKFQDLGPVSPPQPSEPLEDTAETGPLEDQQEEEQAVEAAPPPPKSKPAVKKVGKKARSWDE